MPLPLLALLLGASPAHADGTGCAAPTSTADVLAALELAEAAYADADLAALQVARDRALQTLPCVSETMSRTLIARFHRTMGLTAFVTADTERAERAFAAARTIEPGYVFPAEVVPPGNPALDHYQAMAVDRPLLAPLDPLPAEGLLLLDGRPATARPASWPVVAQVLDETGRVQATSWTWPDEALPAYPRALPVAQVAVSATPPTTPLVDQAAPERGRRKLPWIVATASCAVATGALLAVSRSAYATWDDDATTDPERLDALRATTNGTFYASVGTAAATVALGVVTVAF